MRFSVGGDAAAWRSPVTPVTPAAATASCVPAQQARQTHTQHQHVVSTGRSHGGSKLRARHACTVRRVAHSHLQLLHLLAQGGHDVRLRLLLMQPRLFTWRPPLSTVATAAAAALLAAVQQPCLTVLTACLLRAGQGSNTA